MAKTERNIIFENDRIAVQEGGECYALCYEGRSVALRVPKNPHGFFKYKKTCSVEKGFLQNLADKLNMEFNTNKFTVEERK